MPSIHHSLSRIFPDGLSDLVRYFDSPPKPDGLKKLWSEKGRRDPDVWIKEYARILLSHMFPHDERWLTLMAMYSLLGDQNDLASPSLLEEINNLLGRAYSAKRTGSTPLIFKSIIGGFVEVTLLENLTYRHYLQKSVFDKRAFHPYFDRQKVLKKKLSEPKPCLEGSTNLDALICGIGMDDRKKFLFIEAKFLSDISKDISYLPVRNQIARNIDCGIDLVTGGGEDRNSLSDFWFLLLTPGMFRTGSYGGPESSPINCFEPWRSRLYCYKMDDYLNPGLLKKDLPHWDGKLCDGDWKIISDHMGWMTFEDIMKHLDKTRLFPRERGLEIIGFFRERGIDIEVAQ